MDELVAIACAAIRRVVGPFQAVVDALPRDAAVCAQFDLGEPRSDHAQGRRPGDLTGPSVGAGHTRFRGRSQLDWRDGDLQHHGRQAVDELKRIMESRPEKGLYVFMHDQLPPDAARRSGRAIPGSWREILGKRSLEANP